MRERAELLDATLDIASAPGQGTTVTAVFPTHRRGIEPERPARAAQVSRLRPARS
jgi:hypothetical protein